MGGDKYGQAIDLTAFHSSCATSHPAICIKRTSVRAEAVSDRGGAVGADGLFSRWSCCP